MNKKVIAQVSLFLVLSGLIVYLTKDWFAQPDIQVMTTIRPNRVPERAQERLGPAIKRQPYTLIFALSKNCELVSVRVFNAAELATNRFAHPLWHLRSESNSVPVKSITYGVPVRGLRPAVRGATAEPLTRGVEYKLLLETATQKAEHTFVVKR